MWEISDYKDTCANLLKGLTAILFILLTVISPSINGRNDGRLDHRLNFDHPYWQVLELIYGY